MPERKKRKELWRKKEEQEMVEEEEIGIHVRSGAVEEYEAGGSRKKEEGN